MVDEGRPFVRTISTLPAGHILWASAMNKGVLAAPPRHRFRICAPTIRASQVPGPQRREVKEHGEVVVESS
jgi:hypothetical protein